MMKVFVKDVCETVQPRVVIFGKQVDNDVSWDCEPAFSSYSSMYLSDFLSFHTLNDETFRQRFL